MCAAELTRLCVCLYPHLSARTVYGVAFGSNEHALPTDVEQDEKHATKRDDEIRTYLDGNISGV